LWYDHNVWFSVIALLWAWNIWDAVTMPKGAPISVVILLWLFMAYGIGWKVTSLDFKALFSNPARAESIISPMLRPDFIAKKTEYDHIQPFSKDGDTAIANIRIVLKHHNRRKSNQSLYDVRDNLRLERLFESKKNHIKLQDILDLKDVKRRNTHCTTTDGVITIDDGTLKRTFTLLSDSILHVNYFYGRVPISWLENDDQEGLQPRVIDYKRSSIFATTSKYTLSWLPRLPDFLAIALSYSMVNTNWQRKF